MLSKFKGCMIGGLIGDCLGAPFEFKYHENIVPMKKIVKFLDDVKTMEEDKAPDDYLQYTDDTAMARQIAVTFTEKRKLEPGDLARSFTKEYFRESWRGYGGSVVEVFDKLRKTDFSDPFKPASEQFDGSGSFGNGAGMRAHPVALASSRQSESDLVETAESVARLTHSHHLGVMGGVVQSLAVYHALHSRPPLNILQRIRAVCAQLEKEVQAETLFQHKLELVEQFLARREDVEPQEISSELGNDVSAVASVPTALYCALSVLNNSRHDKTEMLEETLKLAITMGGDTDTIASMACAITGAHLGLETIPRYLYTSCEDYQQILELAEEMYDGVCNTTDEPSPKRVKSN